MQNIKTSRSILMKQINNRASAIGIEAGYSTNVSSINTSPSPSSVTIFEYNIQPRLNNQPVETFSWGQVFFTLDRSLSNFSYTATTTFIPLSFNSTLKTNLTKVTIGNSVTSIGDRAFLECYALTSVTIPDSVTSIGKNAFSTCRGLTSLKIGNSVTSIGDSAFQLCAALTSVTIPNSVTSIGNNAFYGCAALTSVTIPDSVTSIGNLTFYGCGELVTVIIGKSVTSIGQAVFTECKSLKLVTIGKSVTIIGVSAFSGCSALTTITIPDSAVTSISNYAFYKCYGLTSIQIPDSVTSIAQLAFDQSGLTSVKMTQKTANTLNISTTSGPVSFFGTDNNVSITIIPPRPPPSVTIFEYNIQPQLNNQPVETFSWGQVFFTLDRSLSNFSYTATTTFIPMPSQSSNSPIKANLTKVTLGNSVTSIGYQAFLICTGLTSVTIPDSVTSIGNNAFYGCDALTSITIPNSVRSIGDNAFYQCTGLISLEIDDAYTSIGNSAFFICSALKNVDLGNSVTSIGYNAFSRCSALTSITIPDLVTSIGSYAFSQCFALRSVKIGISVTSIGNNAFFSNNITYNTSTNQFGGLDAVLKSVKMTQKTANTLDISTTSGLVSFFGSGFAYGRNAAPATLKVTSIIIIP